MSQDRAYWLAWSQIKGIGVITLKRIEQHFGSLEIAWEASAIELAAVEGLGKISAEKAVAQRNQIHPQQLLQEHLKSNPLFWTPADPEYPSLLLETPSPPAVLYYRGTIDLTENLGEKPIIAIVGTRYPTKYGRDWTRRISKILTQQGFTIISGMAAGIDTEAHQACLNTGGRTIAVLGTGVDVVYPYSNRQLHQTISEKGLIISEYPQGTQPNRTNFPARNRIIAGWSRATLIMEAPQRSGALITARYANEFCRDVYVLPGSLDNQQAIGCLNLLNRGAHVILGENQLLEMLAVMPQLDTAPVPIPNPAPSQTLPHLEPKLAQIVRAIQKDCESLDAIAIQTKLDTGTLLASLSQLEIMGIISQLPGMRYQVNQQNIQLG